MYYSMQNASYTYKPVCGWFKASFINFYTPAVSLPVKEESCGSTVYLRWQCDNIKTSIDPT